MCRTGGLTRSCTGLIAVDLVLVAIILAPLLRSPLCRIRKFLLRIGDLAVLCAELLSELCSAGRAILHAAAACHTVFLGHMCAVCRTGHVRCIEKLGSAQRVADADCTVTDCKNLILAVDVGDLMYITHLLSAL